MHLSSLHGVVHIVLLPYYLNASRLNLKRWQERGFCVVAWTVNSKEEKEYFQNVLKVPILTDAVPPDSSAPEQGGH